MENTDNDYHLALLKALISGLEQDLTHQQLASYVNAHGLTTPYGRKWSASSIKETLKKLRNHLSYPSKLYREYLKLIYSKKLSIPESLILMLPKHYRST